MLKGLPAKVPGECILSILVSQIYFPILNDLIRDLYDQISLNSVAGRLFSLTFVIAVFRFCIYVVIIIYRGKLVADIGDFFRTCYLRYNIYSQ